MNRRDAPESPDRRRFLEVARRYGFSTAVLAATGGILWNESALAQTAADEEAKQKAAKFTMLFATEYKIEDWVKYPVMQSQFKANVETLTKNQIFVKLHPAGQLGIGPALAQKVQGGTVHGGAVSLSNFSPFTKTVDLINIPYWCGDNQRYANLVTSAAWNNEITPKVVEKGYKPMFYFTVDPRTVATRRGFGKTIKAPSDMQGVKMRVPASKLLQKLYRLAGANPTVVAWGETPSAIKQGVADALDPSLAALATFGFHDILESVTFVRTVSDAQMFAANAGWFNGLPKDLQSAFEDASHKTQIETFAQIAPARTESMKVMAASGTKFYNPTAAEMKQWMDTCGEQRKEWDEDKIELAGSLANFDKLKVAANTKGPITVGDYQG